MLDVVDGRALILSDGILAHNGYNIKDENVTWDKYALCEHLKGVFCKDTFNDKEKERK